MVLADELSDAQIKAFRLLANRSASWAEWDDELLRLELADLQSLDFDLALTSFGPDELAGLLDGGEPENEGLSDDDAAPEPEEHPVSKLGDLWLLDAHKLLSGLDTLQRPFALPGATGRPSASAHMLQSRATG